MANPGDQTGNFSNAYSIWRSIVEPRLIAFRFKRKLGVDWIVRKAQEVSTDCVATSVDAASRNGVDDHSRIEHLKDPCRECLESNGRLLEILENHT